MNQNMLKVGRIVGLDNWAQIKQLAQRVKSKEIGTYAAHLKMDKSNYDLFLSLNKDLSPELAQQMGIIEKLTQKFFPRATSGEAIHFTDIIIKIFGENSKILEIAQKTKDSQGIVAQGAYKVLGNKYGSRIKMNTTAENISLRANMNMNHGKSGSVDALKKLATGIDYKETGEMANLSLKAKDVGFVTDIDLKMEAPTEYMNTIAELTTGTTFKDIVSNAKIAVK